MKRIALTILVLPSLALGLREVATSDPVVTPHGQYLEARQLMGQKRFALALPLLEEAKRLGLPTLRLERELSRMRGITYFALGRYAESVQAWNERAWTSRAAGADAARWLERIEYAESGTLNPTLPGPSSARPAAP